MDQLVGIIAVLLICLILTIIAFGQKRSSRDSFIDAGLNLTQQGGSIKTQGSEVMTSEIPDVCPDLTEYDCLKTKGCEFSREVGMCVKVHEVREKAAHGDLMNNITFY